MPNLAETAADLERYIKARVPAVVLRTIEAKRATDLLRDTATNYPQMPFYLHTRARGLRDLRTGQSIIDGKSLYEALDYAEAQFTSRGNVSFVFLDPDDIGEDNATSRLLVELVRLAEDGGGMIHLITDAPVWTGISRLGMSLNLDPPDAEEMRDILFKFLDNQRGHLDIRWSEDDLRRAADIVSGMTEAEAINMMATLGSKGGYASEDVEELSRLKDRLFSNLNGIERVVLRQGDNSVGGLDNLRGWLADRHKLIDADLRGTALRPPRGVLLVGVPGCGKSLSAKAIAGQWKLPLYRLDFASILGKWVGQSEGQLREALEAADRTAPCVLWIDEIEKGLAGQDDSTGVGRRMVGQFLFWLQESTAKVFVVATANDVRSLPPELLRKGRFDELFFVDLPTADERRDIISLYLAKYVTPRIGREPDPQLVKSLVIKSEGFAGSDIEAAVHEVGTRFIIEPEADFDPAFVERCFENTVPFSRTNPDQVAEIRQWGRDRALPAGRPTSTASEGGRPTYVRQVLT